MSSWQDPEKTQFLLLWQDRVEASGEVGGGAWIEGLVELELTRDPSAHCRCWRLSALFTAPPLNGWARSWAKVGCERAVVTRWHQNQRSGVCACACVHVCVHVCAHVCMHACVRVCVCVCIFLWGEGGRGRQGMQAQFLSTADLRAKEEQVSIKGSSRKMVI